MSAEHRIKSLVIKQIYHQYSINSLPSPGKMEGCHDSKYRNTATATVFTPTLYLSTVKQDPHHTITHTY